MSAPQTPERVEKIMALTRAEFAAALRALDPAAAPQDGAATLAAGEGAVRVAHEPLPPVTLGGLLSLPRARVTLGFSGVSPADRAAFLARFDLAFRRGGG